MYATEYVLPIESLSFLGTVDQIKKQKHIKDNNISSEHIARLSLLVVTYFPFVKQGDMIALVPKSHRLENENLLIWNGSKVMELAYDENMGIYGQIPNIPNFRISDSNFHPKYWSRSLYLNLGFWPDPSLFKRVLDGVKYGGIPEVLDVPVVVYSEFTLGNDLCVIYLEGDYPKRESLPYFRTQIQNTPWYVADNEGFFTIIDETTGRLVLKVY